MTANTTLFMKKVWQSHTTAVGTATRHDSASENIYVPMTTDRAFQSVILMCTVHDNTATPGNITNPLIGIKLGAAAFSDVTLGNPPSTSGETGSFVFIRDVTSYFNTNFGSGASQTAQCAFQATNAGTTPAFMNITFELYMAIDVNDSDNTQFNYVEFVCDSSTGALTASQAEIGTNQFPVLDTVLGESSKTIRQVWIEFSGNDGLIGTTGDSALECQIDSQTAFAFGVHEGGSGSASYFKLIYDVTSLGLSTASAHAIQLRSTLVTNGAEWNHVGIKVCVMYEYSWSASSRITNMCKASLPIIGFSVGSSSTAQGGKKIHIQEPGTITMRQSGVEVFFSATSNTTTLIAVGSQATRTYTPANALFCGSAGLTQRIDSGGVQGAGISLARGLNDLIFRATAGAGNNASAGWNGCATLVYESDKSSIGRRAHVKSLPRVVHEPTEAAAVGVGSTSVQGFGFVDADYYVVDLWYDVYIYMTGINAFAYTVFPELVSGELEGVIGYRQHPFIVGRAESENFQMRGSIPGCEKSWDRWANDPDTIRMGLGTARNWTCSSLYASSLHSVIGWSTIHGHKKAISGTVSNSGGGTVTIKSWSKLRQCLVGSTSRSGNGAYSIPWYDDTASDITVEAREGSSYLGRSDDTTAS